MKFNCTVRDLERGVVFTIQKDEADGENPLGQVIVSDDEGVAGALPRESVRYLEYVEETSCIVTYFFLGDNFDVVRLAIVVPVPQGNNETRTPAIAFWQSELDDYLDTWGYSEEQRNSPERMARLVEELRHTGIRATRPSSYATTPGELVDAQPVELILCHVTL